MAHVSVGQLGVEVTYDFDTPFTIDSEGQGFGDGTFTQGAGDTLAMREFHGVLAFAGPVSSLSFADHTGRVLARVHVRHARDHGYQAEHAGGSWPRPYCSRLRPPPPAIVRAIDLAETRCIGLM